MAGAVRVLYIDDDAGLGVLLSHALAPHGYSVETLESSEDALARLADTRFDVVALDHNLVNEVGLDIIPKIRALSHAPPIIYVTGSEDVRIAVAALKAGAVDYVWKDVQGHYRELLRQAIDTALAQEKLKRESEEARLQITEARDRAEMLLKEVNHRVANSLAIVSSFVQMQANAMADPSARSMLRDTQARIAAIAGVHRRLYTSSDVRFVDVNEYLRSLVEELATTLNHDSEHLKFAPSSNEILLGTDKAVSLGVIITELVTNASKYAYEASHQGQIRVSVDRLPSDVLAVVVEDDGIGWNGTGPIQGSGLGSRIIKAMAHSLQASLDYDTTVSGTRAVVLIASH